MTRRLAGWLAGVAVLASASHAAARAGLPAAVAPALPVVSVDPPYQVGLGSSVHVGLHRGGAWGVPTAALADASGLPIAATSVPMNFNGAPADPAFFYDGDLPLNPPDAHCGSNSIVVTLYPRSGAINLDPVPYHVFCPTISADPPRVPQEHQATRVDVTFTDFDPDNDSSLPKTLLFDGAKVGDFKFGEPVSFTADAACGMHTIELTQPTLTLQNLDVTTPFRVYCPSVLANPDPVEKGESIAVTANKFRPGRPVDFTISGRPVGTGTPDSTGSVTIAVDGKDLRCGTDPVLATQPDPAPPPGDPALTLTATTTERVTCHVAHVSVRPGVLQLGTTGHVVGRGFLASAPLTMRWRWTDGVTTRVQAAPESATAKGGLDFTTLLFSLERLGPRALIVSDGLHTARASVLVNPSSMQPSGGPGLTLRH